MINIAAQHARKKLGLSDSEFLPFAAAWEPVRDGYLAWLAGHEATGACFDAAEIWREMPLGPLTLIGQIDRIDRDASGQALLIDYKTPSWRFTPLWLRTTRWLRPMSTWVKKS